jgi:hypothetical protein
MAIGGTNHFCASNMFKDLQAPPKSEELINNNIQFDTDGI